MSIMVAMHSIAFVLGVFLVLASLRSAIRTFVLPRSVNDSITSIVFGLKFRQTM